MLDSLPVTARPLRRKKLAARCLLDEVGLPVHVAGSRLAHLRPDGCPAPARAASSRGKGRYSGILIRKERKVTHGSMKLIEGRLDVSPSRSSSSRRPDQFRDVHGRGCRCPRRPPWFQVEGCLCLVRFLDYSRGMLRMAERGYRVASVFDIFTDFMATMEDEEPILYNPTKRFGVLDAGALRRQRLAPHGPGPGRDRGISPDAAGPGRTVGKRRHWTG